jgi:hypothetical protein
VFWIVAQQIGSFIGWRLHCRASARTLGGRQS